MRKLSLRANQLLLVVGTALPLIALAVWFSGTLIAHNRETVADNAVYRVRAFMSAVDAELKGTIASLQALAVSERLEVNDFAGFHREARRFLQFQPRLGTVSLATPDGRIIVNTRVAFNSGEQRVSDTDSFKRLLETRAPVIGDLAMWTHTKRYTINVRVPILRGGRIAYVLSANIDPAAFDAMLESQRLPGEWASGLVDRAGRIIARRPAVAPHVTASPDFIAAVASSRDGWYRGKTIEGRDTYTAFTHSDYSGWSLGLAIPVELVFAPAMSATRLMAVGFLISLGIAFLFAYAMSRRISRPIAELAASARSFSRAPVPPRPLASNISEVADLESALAGAASAVRERHSLLEREKAALQASDKAKNEFLAMLSHELRNPLAVLTTSVHLLRMGKPGDELMIRTQAIIERQLKQMTRLIEDLLDVSRVTMGKASLKRETFDLAELVSRTVSSWAPAHDGSRRVDVDAEPVWVNADRARIEQVLVNLLDNANKFSPPDKPIAVTVGRKGDAAVLTVMDRGEGIPPHMLEQVFGLFVQGEQGPDRGRGGMGVGLALVRRLVEMHDGSVTAQSAGSGQGATFTVKLAAVAPVTAASPDSGPHSASARRILLVEDNPDGRDMMRMLLELDGHRVTVAADGLSAVKLFPGAQPDIAFVDIGLPDIDGYEVARRLRNEEQRNTVLVALTGYGQAQDERRAVDAGFNLHLVKPVTVDQLRQVIAAA